MEPQNFQSSNQDSILDNIINEPIPVTKNIRFLNYIIDLIVIYLLMFLLGIILAVTGNPDIAQNRILIQVFTLTVFFLYYFSMENISGRTIGKLITGSKVISINGGKPASKQIALRSLSRLVPLEVFSFLGNQGWHDRWTDTMVVKNK